MTQRHAIVTGGTRGIGKAIVERLVKEKYKVTATYFGNTEAAKALEKEFGVKTYKFSVANFEDCAKTIAKIEKENGPIDILVNNAGITRDSMLHKMPKESWDEVIETNLNSVFNMCHAVVNGMRERGYGRIVNISSINGQKGQLGQANYAAAKAGIIGFTKSLALEGARKGITANVICPGYIETDMTHHIQPNILESIKADIPMGRLGQPSEIAHAVSYLVSEEAAFVTGSTLSVNGGQYLA